jgi:hypothetical protein
MSFFNKGSWRIKPGPNKRKSSIQINQNTFNFFNKGNEGSKTKTSSVLNDKKTEKINNSLYENCKADFEKKNKAKRCLLYLLNIKSKGTFCPQIVEYFKNIKKTKIKAEDLGEIIEKDLENQEKIKPNIEEKKPHEFTSKFKTQIMEKQTGINFINLKNDENKEKEENINQENNIINENNELNFDFKDSENFIIENTESEKKEDTQNKIDLNQESQENKNVNEEIQIENKNENEPGYLNEKKIKKNSKKKNTKRESKIDTIYNLQRSELQKYGNYHSSLRNAIQSNLGKKKLRKKK